MKSYLLLTLFVLFSLVGCTTQANPADTAVVTSAAPLPTATETLAPTVTNTPEPTSTQQPTETPLPTATPVPEVITGQNASRLQLVRRFGNGRMVHALLSPQADQLVVLTTIALKAYDPDSGKLIWETETGSPQQMAAYTADGSAIVSISADGGVLTWDPATGKILKTALPVRDGIDFVSLNSSGSVVSLTSSGKITTVVEVSSADELGSNNGLSLPEGINSSLVSPDGSMFWTDGYDSGNRQQIQAWETKGGKFLRGLQGIGPNYIVELAISPDGKWIAGISRLALTSKVEYTLWVWDTATALLLKKIPLPDNPEAFAFIPAQEKVVVAIPTKLRIVDLRSGELEPSFGHFNSPILSLNIAAGGKALVAASANGRVKVINLETRKPTREIAVELSQTIEPYTIAGQNYKVRYPRFSGMDVDPAGKFLAVLSPERLSIDLIDPASLKVIKSFGYNLAQFSTFDVSADGSMIAAVDMVNAIWVFRVSSGSVITTIFADNQNFIRQVEISPDRSMVAALSGGGLGELYLWKIASGEKMRPLSGYNTMAFSPDGKVMVSDNVDFGLYAWDIASGKKIASPSADWIFDLNYSPDGKNIAVSGFEVHKTIVERENLISIFDTATYKLLPMKLVGHPAIISEVCYSPDGKIIVSADAHGTVRLWNAESGELLHEIRETAPGPVHMAFMPDNRKLVIGGGDGTLLFYEVR